MPVQFFRTFESHGLMCAYMCARGPRPEAIRMQRLSPLRYTNVLASSVDMRKVGVSGRHWDWGWLALTGRPVHVHVSGFGIR